MRCFRFTLPDHVLREMNRQQYKSAMRWLRLTARIVDKKINWPNLCRHINNVMTYGTSVIRESDLVRQ